MQIKVQKLSIVAAFGILLVVANACKKDTDKVICSPYTATPYNLEYPAYFPPMDVPEDNLTTLEGVALGKKLFFDPILSGDNSQSCGSCHNQAFGFTDNGNAVSIGIDGSVGTRNSMALINLGWNRFFFWDGRSNSLEKQAEDPVRNPIEMHESWVNAIEELKNHAEYPELFKRAFNINPEEIDSVYAAKAIAQFERTLISKDSKFDRKTRGELLFTAQERLGESIFFSEKGDCFHCHGAPLFTDHVFHNNGLQNPIVDQGLADFTGNASDAGLMKSPTLRNIAFTAPYMHDGRFNTLEEVVDFYASNVDSQSPNIDPLMTKDNRPNGQLSLTADEKAALVAFLHTLSDSTFIQNPAFLP